MRYQRLLAVVLLLSITVLSGCQTSDLESQSMQSIQTEIASEESLLTAPSGWWLNHDLTEEEWSYYASLEASYDAMPATEYEINAAMEAYYDVINILNTETIYKIRLDHIQTGDSGAKIDITDSEEIAKWVNLVKKYEVSPIDATTLGSAVGGQLYGIYFYYNEDCEPAKIFNTDEKITDTLDDVSNKVVLNIDNFDEIKEELIELEQTLSFSDAFDRS